MIVDFHTHLFEPSWLPDRWWTWLTEYYNSRRDHSLLSKRDASVIIEQLCDYDGSKLLRAMDDAKIDRSVVLPLDWGILLGEPSVPIEEQHRQIAAIAKKSDGRIIPFVGIDPRRENASELIRCFVKDYKMKGIKLYPAAGFDLRNDAYRFVFEIAREYAIPVLLHTGFSFGPFFSEFCGPGMLDHLCAAYPEVTLIAAHLGAGHLEQLCWLGYAKPNLFADCSLMQVRARQNYSEFAANIRLACDLFGSGRILYGSDWPFSQSVMRNIDYVNAFKKLTSAESPGAKFASYELRQMLGGNAEKLLTKAEGIDDGN